MKRKKTSKVYRRRTLEVKAAHAAGARVIVSPVPKVPERPRLELKPEQWPGWAGNRSIIAAMDYTEKDVKKVFTENPSSQWVITPYEVIERSEFFAPKSAPEPVAQAEQSTSNPS